MDRRRWFEIIPNFGQNLKSNSDQTNLIIIILQLFLSHYYYYHFHWIKKNHKILNGFEMFIRNNPELWPE